MQLHKIEDWQVRAGPNQSQTKKAKAKLWSFSSQNTVEACVPRYFKVGAVYLFLCKVNIVFM